MAAGGLLQHTDLDHFVNAPSQLDGRIHKMIPPQMVIIKTRNDTQT